MSEHLFRQLKCNVRGVRYYPEGCHGVLDMEDGHCCDMTGCVALFKGIDPGVEQIDTYSGLRKDTSYFLGPKGWEAAPPPRQAQPRDTRIVNGARCIWWDDVTEGLF